MKPLHNYDATLQSLDLLSSEDGLGIGQRHITVSTVGLVPAIRRFADEGKQFGLAISLHGQHDEVCPAEDAREITAGADSATICEVEFGRHNDLWTNEAHREQASEAIRVFLSRLNPAPDTP